MKVTERGYFMADEMTPEEEEALRREVEATFGKAPQESFYFKTNEYSRIKHVIGVVSGKGGVGKSIVTGILACELARKGYKVGILDADITGPSIPKMFGLSDERIMGDPELSMMIPVTTKGGIRVVSTNLILENETDPVLWRGPILMGVLKQFWEETVWGEIDYLLVDMPPGTGDVALTVFQQVPIDGLIIVTAPQGLVQMVVSKAVNMAQEMNVPVLGLVENMAYAICPDCGKHIEVFGPSQTAKTAQHDGLTLLGSLPIDPTLAASCDKGSFEQDLPENLLPDAVKSIVQASAHFGN